MRQSLRRTAAWATLSVCLTTLPVPGCTRPNRPSSTPAQTSASHGQHPGIRFEEVGLAAGLRFEPVRPTYPLTIRSAFGYGCGFVDYDEDGWLDVLVVGEPRCALFRNLGDGTFRDVSRDTGIAAPGPWHGCAAGDFDADGWTDLYITGFRRGRLLRNRSGRRFEEVPARWPHGWESSAGFADVDADGDLDLYVGNYVEFGPGSLLYCELVPGVRSGCPPSRYRPEFGRLLRNDGGRFTDITAAAGLRGNGKNLAIGFLDHDRDGRLDIYVANDGTPADLFRNLGTTGGVPRFKNVGLTRGCALSADGRAQAAMGVAWGDYDRDGWFDLAVTAFSGEPFSVYRNSRGFYDHVSAVTGIAAATLPALGFGVRWLDADNDGWPDLVFANGHVYDNAEQIEPGTTYRQRPMLFRNVIGQRFEQVTDRAGTGFETPLVARGLAAGDYNRDGRVDLLLSELEGRPRLLRSVGDTGNHWLTIRLAGGAGNPRGEGAEVVLRTPTGERRQLVSAVGSYLSTNEPAAHFGLGSESRVLSGEVRWPDGEPQSFAVERVDCEILVRRLRNN